MSLHPQPATHRGTFERAIHLEAEQGGISVDVVVRDRGTRIVLARLSDRTDAARYRAAVVDALMQAAHREAA